MLGLLVNVVAGALLAVTIGFYVLIYTMWLKRWTPQNIVIGGAAGALPPVIGWASVTGSVDPRADPPVPHHLLLDAAALLGAVALSHRGLCPRRHADAAGRRRRSETRRQILLYSLLLAPLGAAPWLLGYAGAIYGVVAVAAGAMMVALALRIASANDAATPPSKQMFAFSLLYLFLLFAVLLADWVAAALFGHVAA